MQFAAILAVCFHPNVSFMCIFGGSVETKRGRFAPRQNKQIGERGGGLYHSVSQTIDQFLQEPRNQRLTSEQMVLTAGEQDRDRHQAVLDTRE